MPKQNTPTATGGPILSLPNFICPPLEPLFGDDVSGLACITNDDLESESGQLRRSAAIERGTVSSDELESITFAATYFYAFRVESKNNEGETTGAHLRIVFMSSEGSTYETHSETAGRTLQTWISQRGWTPWQPSLRFVLVRDKGKSGRTYHVLRLVTGVEPKPMESDG